MLFFPFYCLFEKKSLSLLEKFVQSITGRLFSLQLALTIDKKSNEAKTLLLSLMDWLEKTKRVPDASESITSEVAAQAYIENYALKLFVWADNMDRAGTFNK